MSDRPVSLPIFTFLFFFFLQAEAAFAQTSPSETPTPIQPSVPVSSAAPDQAIPKHRSERTITYVVVPHDTLAKIGDKFGVSIQEIKERNHITISYVVRGQVLEIPTGKFTSTRKTGHGQKSKSVTLIPFHRGDPNLAATPAASSSTPDSVPGDQVPDRFVPANASATVPVANAKAQPTYLDPSGPLQAGYADDVAQTQPVLPQIIPTPGSSHRRKSTASARASSAPTVTYAAPPPAPSPSPAPKRGLFNFFYTPPPTVDWSNRFTQVARELGDRNLDYNDDWRPPGESRSWAMDCSNTTRYIYRATTGIKLPRTASDQYYYLHLQNKAWDVPQLASGFADCDYLRQNLKPGDLLFWENTYRPDRQPPITHVMIFLGSNARGQWIMAGSQSSRGGEHNRRHGGPDIYVFNPSRPCGGYTTWMGLVHHQGRFCAFGRPLEADKSKLDVADN